MSTHSSLTHASLVKVGDEIVTGWLWDADNDGTPNRTAIVTAITRHENKKWLVDTSEGLTHYVAYLEVVMSEEEAAKRSAFADRAFRMAEFFTMAKHHTDYCA